MFEKYFNKPFEMFEDISAKSKKHIESSTEETFNRYTKSRVGVDVIV